MITRPLPRFSHAGRRAGRSVSSPPAWWAGRRCGAAVGLAVGCVSARGRSAPPSMTAVLWGSGVVSGGRCRPAAASAVPVLIEHGHRRVGVGGRQRTGVLICCADVASACGHRIHASAVVPVVVADAGVVPVVAPAGVVPVVARTRVEAIAGARIPARVAVAAPAWVRAAVPIPAGPVVVIVVVVRRSVGGMPRGRGRLCRRRGSRQRADDDGRSDEQAIMVDRADFI